MIALASQVPAQQAASNLASYAAALHLDSLARSLSSPVVDTWGRGIGVSLILLTLTLWFFHRVRRRKLSSDGASYPLAAVADLPKARTLYPPEAASTKQSDVSELGRSAEKEVASTIVGEWLLPPNAIKVFGSPNLTIRLSELVEQSKSAYARGLECEEKIREIRRSARDYNSVQTVERAIDPWREKMSAAAFEHDALKKEIRATQISLENQIHRELEGGSLLAKGFRYPNNEDETVISPSKWRDMSIDFIKYIAFRNHDQSVLFTSVLIGRSTITKPSTPSANENVSDHFTVPEVSKNTRKVGQEALIQQALERQRIETARVADFRAWDRVQVLTLRQAAHLWSEERPMEGMGRLSQLTEVVLNELVDAAIVGGLMVEPCSDESDDDCYVRNLIPIDDGKLRIKNSTSEYNSYSRVTRANLRAYAASRNERPSFLFPEDR